MYNLQQATSLFGRVPWLRLLVVGLSPRKTGFNPRPAPVGSVDFLGVFRFSQLLSFRQCSRFILVTLTNGTCSQQLIALLNNTLKRAHRFFLKKYPVNSLKSLFQSPPQCQKTSKSYIHGTKALCSSLHLATTSRTSLWSNKEAVLNIPCSSNMISMIK